MDVLYAPLKKGPLLIGIWPKIEQNVSCIFCPLKLLFLSIKLAILFIEIKEISIIIYTWVCPQNTYTPKMLCNWDIFYSRYQEKMKNGHFSVKRVRQVLRERVHIYIYIYTARKICFRPVIYI